MRAIYRKSSSRFIPRFFNSLREAEPYWRTLETMGQTYVFQTYDWATLWYETIGSALRVEPCIVVVSDDDGPPSALFPLAIRQRGRCRILEFLGAIVTDYNLPLFDQNASPPNDHVDGLWDQVIAALRPDLVNLQQMPEYLADGARNPLISLPRSRHSTNAHFTRLPSSFAEFQTNLNGDYVRVTRRRRRRLAEKGRIIFETLNYPDKIKETVELLLLQKRRKYGSDYVDPAAMAPFENFYRQLAVAVSCSLRPVTARLQVNETVVASSLGVIRCSRYYGLMSGHEAGEWAHMSPGRHLKHEIAQWCISAGISTLDMTVGDEDYKRYLCNESMKLYESCYPLSAAGAAFLAAKRVKQHSKALAGALRTCRSSLSRRLRLAEIRSRF